MTVWSRMAGRSPSGEADQPFALVEKGVRGLTLSAVNPAARRLGLSMGQAHADARAAVPGLVSHPARPDDDRQALRRLALWAERYSPCVAMDAASPGREGLLIDMTGGAHLFGGELALMTDIALRLKAAGIPARLAMADSAGAAWALARFGPPGLRRIAPVGGTRAALAPLPVSALRLEEADVKLLSRLGLRTIGDLIALPRSGLARRFRGERGLTLVRRLDQALGAEPEILEPVRPPPAWRVWRTVLEPLIDVPGIETVLSDLALSLVELLERDGQGARRLALTGFRVDGGTTTLEVALSAPSARPVHLAKVLKERGLERLDLGFGVDALMLTAELAEPLVAVQSDIDRRRDSDQALAWSALLDRLGARLGESAVHHLQGRPSWMPERSQRRRPALKGPPTAVEAAPGLAERPLVLLDPPEPVEASLTDLPDGAPRLFRWRRATHRVTRVQGPERLSVEWWRPARAPRPPRTRDYYRVEDSEGRRYWLYREGLYGREDRIAEPLPNAGGTATHEVPWDPQWWMHGVYA